MSAADVRASVACPRCGSPVGQHCYSLDKSVNTPAWKRKCGPHIGARLNHRERTEAARLERDMARKD